MLTAKQMMDVLKEEWGDSVNLIKHIAVSGESDDYIEYRVVSIDDINGGYMVNEVLIKHDGTLFDCGAVPIEMFGDLADAVAFAHQQ